MNHWRAMAALLFWLSGEKRESCTPAATFTARLTAPARPRAKSSCQLAWREL